MKNAIVILNYNDSETTIKLVEHIKSFKKINHIIIVDNCSTDNSYDTLNRKYKQNEKIELIATNNNKGYASGNNFGINYAIDKYNCDFVIVANPDIMFKEELIDSFNKYFSNNDDIAILAPMVSKGYNSWKLPNFLKVIASLFLILDKLLGNEVYKNQTEELNYVDVVAGSLFAIKSEIFKKINGFDERTFLYYEENILAYKLKKENYKSAIMGKVFYDHCHAASIKKVYKSKVKLFKIVYKSIKIYANNYLEINKIQKCLLSTMYTVALVERHIYDLLNKFILRFIR